MPTDVDYVCNFAVVKSNKWEVDLAGNAEAAGLLMAHCRTARAFLHCSSTGVYEAADGSPQRETDPLGDNHRVMMPTYSIAKIAAEAVVRTTCRLLEVPTTIARLNVPYGDGGGWPAFHLALMQAGHAVPVHPNGPSRFNPIHDDDILATLPGHARGRVGARDDRQLGRRRRDEHRRVVRVHGRARRCRCALRSHHEHDRRHPHRQHEAPRARRPDDGRLEGRHAPDGGDTRGWRSVVTCRHGILGSPAVRNVRTAGLEDGAGRPSRIRRTSGPRRSRSRSSPIGSGYDSIWVYDHYHNVPVPAHETMFECWTTLAALASVTTNVRLGQMVGCAPYRNPGLLAKITSNIDVISRAVGSTGGSAPVGTSTSTTRTATASPRAKDRIRMLRETVEIVKSMWSEPDTTYDGKFFQLDGAQCDPKPLQDPHPPIWIGGGGEQLTLRVVARHADRSNFGGKPHEFQHKCEVLQGHCREVGRDYDEIVKTWSPEVFVRETEQEIIDAGSKSLLGRALRFVARGKSRGHAGASVREDPGLHGARPRGHRGLAVGLPGHRDRPAVRREGHPRVPLSPPRRTPPRTGVNIIRSASDIDASSGDLVPEERKELVLTGDALEMGRPRHSECEGAARSAEFEERRGRKDL